MPNKRSQQPIYQLKKRDLITGYIVIIFSILGFGLFISNKLTQIKINPPAPAEVQGIEIQAVQEIVYNGTTFTPSNLIVDEGDTVQWTNNSSSNLSVNSNPHPGHTSYAPLNLGDVATSGGTITLQFNTPGTYSYHNHYSSSQGGTIQVNSDTTPTATATVTPTATTTTTATATPTVTETEEEIDPNEITYEKTKDRFIVDGISYSFNEIPEIPQGEKITIAGTTESFLDIEITIRSMPKVFSTTADSLGKWEIDIFTDTLEVGNHTFQTVISDPDNSDRELEFNPIPFKVIAGQVESLPETGDNAILDFINQYQYYIGAAVLLIIAVIIMVIMLRKKPASKKQPFVEQQGSLLNAQTSNPFSQPQNTNGVPEKNN